MTNEMSKAKKIYVNKNDEAALVIERVIDAQSDLIVLSIPKFSRFAQSESNFHLLKKEIETLGKDIRIESVDDRVLELALTCEIPAENPFFSNPERQFSDIIPQRGAEGENSNTVFVKSRATPIISRIRDEGVEEEIETPEKIAAEIESQFGPEVSRRRISRKGFLLLTAVLVFSGLSGFLALRILPEAEVRLVTQKENYVYANAVVVDKSIRVSDALTMRVPGQIFTERRNVSLVFPATGKKYVSKKASGKITIYNAYSSVPQKLVASTRFVAPDGHIFRLASAVTVPGAKIVDGKIEPSSIEASVVADQPGANYNVGSSPRFEIPGFKGTARYSTFYGESTTAMIGGYIGEVAYPTDEDIRKAKIVMAKTLEDGARSAITSKIPTDFKMVQDAFLFGITKQTVNPDTNSAGEFSIFAEADLSLMAFREQDMAVLLGERAVKEKGPDYNVKSSTLTYGDSRVDMVVGRMTVAVDYNAVLARNLAPEEIKSKMLRKSESELTAMFMSMRELEKAEVSFWPFWVKRVPATGAKVNVIVD